MHASPVRRLAALAVAIPLVVGVAGCGDEEDKGKANAACPSDLSNTVSTQLPSDVPSPSGTAYKYSNQGKTQVWFFAVDGSADNLASLRDAYDTQLTGKGYKIEGTDQEEGAEAESEFSGPHDGTTNFKPLCTGKIDVRLKLTS
ncbi:MAG: hypothetical protein QOG34_1079 [Frankiaceae bacterium]|nr:hypothetical protein [Frankiaceae bacterium]